MYTHVFMKSNKDFNRYWASISTEAVDIDGEGSGEYYQASVEVKMSSKAKEVFEENAQPTNNKKIVGGNFEITDFWLKAGKPYEDDEGNEKQRLILFINKMDTPEQKSKKPVKKASGAKKRAAADAEDA